MGNFGEISEESDFASDFGIPDYLGTNTPFSPDNSGATTLNAQGQTVVPDPPMSQLLPGAHSPVRPGAGEYHEEHIAGIKDWKARRAGRKAPVSAPAAEADPGYRDLGPDASGYIYRQFPDGSIQIVSGPGNVGKTFAANSQAAQNVASAFGTYPVAKAKAASPGSSDDAWMSNVLDAVTGIVGSRSASASTDLPSSSSTSTSSSSSSEGLLGMSYRTWAALALGVTAVGAGYYFLVYRKKGG